MMVSVDSSKHIVRQYVISFASVIIISCACYPISNLIGYRTVALILLCTVSILAIFLSIYPVLVAAVLSALIWDLFFIPPQFTLHIEKAEDILMLIMYFIIALLNGVLTSKIRQYERFSQQREERVRILQLYKTLFNSISHEFRTPIATIMGSSENLLLDDTKISLENKKKLVEEINIASERLNRLVDNLLNMSRVESGFIQPKLDWCDMTELIHSVVNRLAKELETHHLNIVIPEEIPLIKIDSGLIEQAIYNLLHNASLYTPKNSTITIKVDYLKSNCMITIADNGKGFPEEYQDKLLSKFYRSDNSRTGGMGLGLSIAKGFIEAHNGSIILENNQPGARFTIKLPAESTNTTSIAER